MTPREVPPELRERVDGRVRDYIKQLPAGDGLALALAWSSGATSWSLFPDGGAWWIDVGVATVDGVEPVLEMPLSAVGFDWIIDGFVAL